MLGTRGSLLLSKCRVSYSVLVRAPRLLLWSTCLQNLFCRPVPAWFVWVKVSLIAIERRTGSFCTTFYVIRLHWAPSSERARTDVLHCTMHVHACSHQVLYQSVGGGSCPKQISYHYDSKQADCDHVLLSLHKNNLNVFFCVKISTWLYLSIHFDVMFL